MGNQAAKDHNVGKLQGTGGPAYSWKIYDATRKATNESVSLFIFDKKILEKLPKPVQKSVIDNLKRDAANLAKLRHPNILHLLNPLVETTTAIVMETEPIFCSLGNAMKDFSNLSPLPEDVQKFQLEELEIRSGLYQICGALNFVHNNAKLIHLNVCPSSIFLTKNGEWKLAGFNFSAAAGGTADEIKELDNMQTYPLKPDLDYLAPEIVNRPGYRASFVSDMFSVGVIAFNLYNLPANIKLLNTRTSLSEYKMGIDKLHQTNYSRVPALLQAALQRLLTTDVDRRLDAKMFTETEYFGEISFRALLYLNGILEKEESQKVQFLKGLLQALPKFPPRVLQQRVIPPLVGELRNPNIVPYVLPNIFWISENIDKSDFVKLILPYLIPVLQMKEPVQIILLLLERVELLLAKCTQEIITQGVLPMIYAAFDMNRVDVIQAALVQISKVAHLIEYQSLKASILPRLQVICLGATIEVVRINTLVCYSKLLPMIDKESIISSVIPTLEKVKDTDRTPSVTMAIISIYTSISKSLGDEITANYLLPQLIPLMLEKALDDSQFSILVHTIKDMMKKLEDARTEQRKIKESVPVQVAKPVTSEWNTFQSLVGGTFEQPSQQIVIEPQPSSFNTMQTEEKPKAITDVLASVAKKTKEATSSVVTSGYSILQGATTKSQEKQQQSPAIINSDFAFFDSTAPITAAPLTATPMSTAPLNPVISTTPTTNPFENGTLSLDAAPFSFGPITPPVTANKPIESPAPTKSVSAPIAPATTTSAKPPSLSLHPDFFNAKPSNSSDSFFNNTSAPLLAPPPAKILVPSPSVPAPVQNQGFNSNNFFDPAPNTMYTSNAMQPLMPMTGNFNQTSTYNSQQNNLLDFL